MNELSKLIKERRSIRRYKKDMVPKELIDQVVEAGLYGATGMGSQSPHFIVVTNRTLRDEISAENRRIGGWQENFDPLYGAPVVILVVVDKNAMTGVYDGSIALGNMMLKAHELGLGSCWIHRAKEEFDSEFGKEILARVGLRGSFEGVGHLILGYPDCELPAAPARKEGRVSYIN